MEPTMARVKRQLRKRSHSKRRSMKQKLSDADKQKDTHVSDNGNGSDFDTDSSYEDTDFEKDPDLFELSDYEYIVKRLSVPRKRKPGRGRRHYGRMDGALYRLASPKRQYIPSQVCTGDFYEPGHRTTAIGHDSAVTVVIRSEAEKHVRHGCAVYDMDIEIPTDLETVTQRTVRRLWRHNKLNEAMRHSWMYTHAISGKSLFAHALTLDQVFSRTLDGLDKQTTSQ